MTGEDTAKIWEVVKEVSGELRRQNIDHALCGGIPIRAFAYPIPITDVDFLVQSQPKAVKRQNRNREKKTTNDYGEAFAGYTQLVVNGVKVDLIVPRYSLNETTRAIAAYALNGCKLIDMRGVPSVPPDIALALKRACDRPKDIAFFALADAAHIKLVGPK